MIRTALAAILMCFTVAPTAFGAGSVLPFIENDYRRAMAQAKAEQRPLFVEVWAPWCHSYNSMRAYVFTDKALEPYVGRFVWLGVDAEDAKNAAFLAKYPMQAVPMLMIINPATGAVALRYA